jgi:glycolate oxidase FAD binding subunit
MPSNALLEAKMPLAAIQTSMSAIVGAAHTRPVEAKDAQGASLIVEPANEQEIAEILRFSNTAGLAVIPRGGGSKLEWGNAAVRADIVLSMRRLARVLEHSWADLTVVVQAGCTVEDLQETLKQHGQRLAIDVLWPDKATIGGILSVNDSGALRLRYGGLRDLIIGVTLALPDGTLASSGGKVVKNVAGYDLPKLVTGALGTLGVITRAVFRLYPLPQTTKTLSVRSETVHAIQEFVLAVQDSKLAYSALEVRMGTDLRPEAGTLFEGTAEGIASQEASIRALAGPLAVSGAAGQEWGHRQALWQGADIGCIVKLAILPSALERTVMLIQRLTARHRATWKIVLQATGIGWLRVEGVPENSRSILQELRDELESNGGSLTVLRQPPDARMEAWGKAGDALPLMKALRQQFDPKATLNPGRFVGGI